MRSTIPIAIFLLLSFGLSTPFFHAVFAAEQQQFTAVVVDGNCGETHTISYTVTDGSAIVSEIKADPAVLALTVTLSGSDDTTERASKNGTLTITVPQHLISEMPAAFVDDENVEVDVQNVTKEGNMTINIDFPAGAKNIEIVGAYIPEIPPHTNAINIDVEGRQFLVRIFSAPVCSYEFSTEQKKLTIHSDNFAMFTVTLPKKMLGGPYSVFLDGKQQMHGVDYSPRYYYGNPTNENFTTISISMPSSERADTIEIVGTTAIPEFGSPVVLAVTAAAIGYILVLARQRHFGLQ